MTLKGRAAALGLLVSALLGTPPSLAQMDMGTGMPVMDWIGPMVQAQQYGNMLRSNLNLDDPAPAEPKASAASLPYTPTAALKKATVQGYVDRLKTKNPAASQVVATNFGPGKYDYAAIYSGLVKGNGLKDNDAIDSVTAYLVLSYMIVNNVQDSNAITSRMVQGVRTQVAPSLAGNAQLTAPGSAGKLGEEMKLQTVVVQGGWQSAIKEQTLPAYQQGIAAMFKSLWGLDLNRLKLTAQGFAKK